MHDVLCDIIGDSSHRLPYLVREDRKLEGSRAEVLGRWTVIGEPSVFLRIQGL